MDAWLRDWPCMHGRAAGASALRPVDEAAMAKALSGNTAVRPINARPGGAIKKGVPRDLFVRGTPVEGAVTYFPTFAVSSAW